MRQRWRWLLAYGSSSARRSFSQSASLPVGCKSSIVLAQPVGTRSDEFLQKAAK